MISTSQWEAFPMWERKAGLAVESSDYSGFSNPLLRSFDVSTMETMLSGNEPRSRQTDLIGPEHQATTDASESQQGVHI
jgi:hypothetical protein